MDNVGIVVDDLPAAVDDLDDMLARLRKRGAQLVDDVVKTRIGSATSAGAKRLLVGLAEQIG
ncbi:MAG: hypothetical protein ACRENE_02380 [Polyangiaceae bacterium]